MSDFEINDGILQRECESIARDIIDELKGEYDDIDRLREEALDRAHEQADGHAWVIYTYKAHKLCAECDTSYGEDLVSGMGSIGIGEGIDVYNRIATTLAYGEMRGRIEAAIYDLVEEMEEA